MRSSPWHQLRSLLLTIFINRLFNGNALTGTIPTEFGRLTNMQFTCVAEFSCFLVPTGVPCSSFSHNNLVGSLPKEIAQMRELWELCDGFWQSHFFVCTNSTTHSHTGRQAIVNSPAPFPLRSFSSQRLERNCKSSETQWLVRR